MGKLDEKRIYELRRISRRTYSKTSGSCSFSWNLCLISVILYSGWFHQQLFVSLCERKRYDNII